MGIQQALRVRMVQLEEGPLTSVRPGLFMEKKMRSTKRVLESSCFSVAGSEASLMPFVRPCSAAACESISLEVIFCSPCQ